MYPKVRAGRTQSPSLPLRQARPYRRRSIFRITIGRERQILTPSADSVVGNWRNELGNPSLAASIDEAGAGAGAPPSDADYIQSPIGPVNEGCRVKLLGGSDPASSILHEIHWRGGKDQAGPPAINLTLQLRQGGGDVLGAGTLIASFSRNDVADGFTDFFEELSAGQADSITNYSDLYLEAYANQV